MPHYCPVCKLEVDGDDPSTKYGRKPGVRNAAGFGQNVDLIDNSAAAFFHPHCDMSRVGYYEAELPGRG